MAGSGGEGGGGEVGIGVARAAVAGAAVAGAALASLARVSKLPNPIAAATIATVEASIVAAGMWST